MGTSTPPPDGALSGDALADAEFGSSVLSSLRTGVMLVDPQTRHVVYVNETAAELIGAPRETIVGKVCHQHVCPAGQKACPVLDLGQQVDHSERILLRADGTRIPILKSVRKVVITGRPLLLENFEDISDLKRLQSELQESRRILTGLMNDLPGMVYWCRNDRDWTMELVSEGTYALTGYQAADLQGSAKVPYADLIHPEDREMVWTTIQEGVRDRKAYQMNCRIRTADGQEKWVWEQGRGVFSDAGELLRLEGFITDTTQARLAQEARLELERNLQQLQKQESLGRLASAVAHNFNNHLQAVLGNLEMILDEMPADSALRPMLKSAFAASKKSTELSGLIMSYLGQHHGQREKVDVGQMAREMLPVLKAAMPEQVRLETRLPEPSPEVEAVVPDLRQAVMNLLSNAWESCLPAGGTVWLEVRCETPRPGSTGRRFPVDWAPRAVGHACIEVRDTGSGIEARSMDKLFDPFFSTKFIGRGLGLPVALGHVRAHRGGILVESVPGQGSRFRIYLPLAEAAGRPAAGSSGNAA